MPLPIGYRGLNETGINICTLVSSVFHRIASARGERERPPTEQLQTITTTTATSPKPNPKQTPTQSRPTSPAHLTTIASLHRIGPMTRPIGVYRDKWFSLQRGNRKAKLEGGRRRSLASVVHRKLAEDRCPVLYNFVLSV